MLHAKGLRQTAKDIETLRLGRFAEPGMVWRNLNLIDDVLVNPGKGWVIHYYDNTTRKYGERLANDDLTDFPGFTTVYLRLAWSYLEPEEGRFEWEVIDAPIRRWTALGKRIAFRISCCESDADQPYATPAWVRAAGARGNAFGPQVKSWEPDYGDPVFLAKLEQFLRAFAQRYDGQPWVDFIDLGSYGVWGEWHTGASTRIQYPADVLKRHIDIHARVFSKSQMVMLYGPGAEIYDYAARTCNAGLRTDSVCVHSYYTDLGGYWFQDMFEKAYKRRPVVVEPAHYRHAMEKNTWQRGAALAHAVETLHPSWVTVHHWPREWLAENRDLAVRLANRMGYWFLLQAVVHPGAIRPGEDVLIQMNWENRGVAPIYRRYPVALSFVKAGSGEEVLRAAHPSADCRRWRPGKVTVNNLLWRMPKDLPAGAYAMRVALVESQRSLRPAILVGTEGRDAEGFYPIGTIKVE